VAGRFEYPVLKYLTTGGELAMWVTKKVGVMFELGWSRSGWKYKACPAQADNLLICVDAHASDASLPSNDDVAD